MKYAVCIWPDKNVLAPQMSKNEQNFQTRKLFGIKMNKMNFGHCEKYDKRIFVS